MKSTQDVSELHAEIDNYIWRNRPARPPMIFSYGDEDAKRSGSRAHDGILSFVMLVVWVISCIEFTIWATTWVRIVLPDNAFGPILFVLVIVGYLAAYAMLLVSSMLSVMLVVFGIESLFYITEIKTDRRHFKRNLTKFLDEGKNRFGNDWDDTYAKRLYRPY